MEDKTEKAMNRVAKVNLSERQSVRTTFRFSEDSLNAINWLVESHELKPKEILDALCADERFLTYVIQAVKDENKEASAVKRNRKTFVISKKALRLLNKYSRENQVARDRIVENLILSFKSVLQQQAEKEKEQEKEAKEIISGLCKQAYSVEEQLKDLLHEDNPILDRFGEVVVVLDNLVGAIEAKLTNGVPIDPEDMSQNS